MIAFDVDDTECPPTAVLTNPRRRPSEPLVPGERYELGEPIARGGMGEVISAHDAPIGREVAIKRMRAPHPTPIALARFLREARIQGRLDHPAIVPVHELGFDDDGRPFFVMKKLSGTTLQQILAAKDSTRFTRHQLLRAFADVCLAIEFAHTRGVIHRDIKPANILLGDFGEVYVLDWGIARVPTDRPETIDTSEATTDDGNSAVATLPGSAIGTPGYMAPEQARAEEVDARADVYALGCVLFEILTGTTLHPRRKLEALRTTMRGVDARPSLRVPDIAPELDELCVRATALDRDARIRSARELGERLGRYLDGDRDLGLRGRLAREHLSIALAAADDEEGRRVAMREAGQALALDPTLAPAAELIGRLMLEPPKQIPAEVRAELADSDREVCHKFVKNAVGMHGFSFVILGMLWLIGLRDSFYMPVFAAFGVVGLTAAVIELRTKRDLMWVHNTWLFIGIALMARCMSPVVIAPIIVAANVIAFAFHPHGQRRRPFVTFVVLASVALFGTWLCEAIGLISPTMFFTDSGLLLVSPLDGLHTLPLQQPAFALYLAIGIVSSSFIAFATARVARAARERSHLQAWQVRQLVPERRDG